MPGFSDYWENEILDHVFGKGVYAPPAVLYVALSAADPDEDGTGVAEPTGGSYTRVETSNTDWAEASCGAICNVDAVEFVQASSDWGTITHFALYDTAVGGNLLAYGALTDPVIVAAGDRVRFAPADLIVALS